MWFHLAPTDLSFLDHSPRRIEHALEIAAPAERVFALAAGERFHDWLTELVACEWTSPAPHGVGSTRIVALDTLAVRERFVAWEPGRRLAFVIEECTVPLVRRMMEHLAIEPLGEARCRLVYTVHYEPSILMTAVHPVARPIFARMFGRAAERIKAIAEER